MSISNLPSLLAQALVFADDGTSDEASFFAEEINLPPDSTAVSVMICKKPSGHQRLLFLSYVTLNCYVTFWTGYVITSDYSRVSSRVTGENIIISESLSRCCCFVSSKGNLPLK